MRVRRRIRDCVESFRLANVHPVVVVNSNSAVSHIDTMVCDQLSCSILILTYNGLPHLEICIPSALAAASRVPGGCPVVVLDNGSSDRTVQWLEQHHPEVQVVVAEKNEIVFSLNPVVASRREDIIIILNNDMRFDEKFILAMLPYFRDPELFAVTARVLNWNGTQNTTGQRLGEIRNYWFYKNWNERADQPCLTLDAGGGCAAFRRSMFMQLGGFDPLYRPAYWEDTDLSYRAWQRGWKVVYEPSSIIYHRVGATLGETHGGRPAITRLIRRNEVIFTLRNVGDWRFVAGYLFLLPFRMLQNARMGNHSMWQGVLQSVHKMPQALLRRLSDGKTRFRSDYQFLAQIRHSTAECKSLEGNSHG